MKDPEKVFVEHDHTPAIAGMILDEAYKIARNHLDADGKLVTLAFSELIQEASRHVFLAMDLARDYTASRSTS